MRFLDFMEITSQSLKLVGDFSHANGQIPLNQATKNAIFRLLQPKKFFVDS